MSSSIKMATMLMAVVVLILSLTSTAQAVPAVIGDSEFEVNHVNQHEFESDEDLANLPEVHLRQRRATCDLGSLSIFGVSLNHSACAAHCIARFHKRGGHCNGNAVCVCRN